jgi:hypothetical protein
MIKDYDIPFDKTGNQLHYPQYEVEWRCNCVFGDMLEITGIQRGQSAAYFHLQSKSTGKKYTMFIRDMLDLIQKTIIDHGIVNARWTFCKRGLNYGIVYFGEFGSEFDANEK